jgi:gas vesicle protein
MKLRDLKDLDKDDILGLIGLESRSSTGSYLAGIFTTFGIGLLVGAGAALFLAPKPGKELRQDLSSKLSRARDQASAKAASLAEDIASKTY